MYWEWWCLQRIQVFKILILWSNFHLLAEYFKPYYRLFKWGLNDFSKLLRWKHFNMYISFAISTLFLTKLRKIYTQFFFVSVTKRYSFYKTCSVRVFGSNTQINKQAFKLTISPPSFTIFCPSYHFRWVCYWSIWRWLELVSTGIICLNI